MERETNVSLSQLFIFFVILVLLLLYNLSYFGGFVMFTCAYLGTYGKCQATDQKCIGTRCDCWNDNECGSEMHEAENEEKEKDSEK